MRDIIRRGIRAPWLPYLILVALAFSFTATHAHENEAFSPYDEYVYYDYVAKVPMEGMVRSGEEVGSDARNELSCRGVINYGAFGEGCDVGTHERDELYPYGGGTGADIYAPPYFVGTWAMAQPFTLVGYDLVDASRWVGAIWLAVGLTLTYALMRALRIAPAAAAGVSAALLSLPSVYWATQYVSTDAPTLAISAGIGLAAVATVRRRVGPWLLPLLSIVAVAFKVQNLAVVVLAALAILIWSVTTTPRGERWRSLLGGPSLAAVISVVAGIAAQGVWLVVRRLAGVADPASVDTTMSVLTPGAIVDESLKFIRSLGETGMPMGTWSTFSAGVFGVIGIGAIIAGLVGRNDPARWSVGVATAFTVAAFGPALAVATTILVGHYIPLPARYGLVVLGAVAVCIAWLVDQGPISRRLTLGVGLLMGLASVVLV